MQKDGCSDREEERPESWQRRSASPRAKEKPSDLRWRVCPRLCRSQGKARVHTEDQTAVHPRVPACDRRHFVVLRVTQEGQGLTDFLSYI